ncbi:MAG: ABC transporter substrate-binding protein [Lachnospiraceae bacterium]|nr:ABC transporter substrate-binding protein [Lachnospiraceae bacterium]
MILHSMEVLNQFEKLNIKTIIDYSSKESTPLGRMEWIKFYGVLTNKEEIADNIFSEKERELLSVTQNNDISEYAKEKLAYFYITNAGAVVIRKNEDYIAKLIEASGANYAFSGLSEYKGTGTMSIQKESFFDIASDCDYLIYNTTISGPLSGLDDLVSKYEVLKNTKAYKNGNIYATNQDIYVKSMELPEIAGDFSRIIKGEEPVKYLYKLK